MAVEIQHDVESEPEKNVSEQDTNRSDILDQLQSFEEVSPSETSSKLCDDASEIKDPEDFVPISDYYPNRDSWWNPPLELESSDLEGEIMPGPTVSPPKLLHNEGLEIVAEQKKDQESITEQFVTVSPEKISALPEVEEMQEISSLSFEKRLSYDTSQIRALLIKCLDDLELDAISFDHFRPAYEKFSKGMRKDEKVHILLEYTDRHLLLDDLMQNLKNKNSNCYQASVPTSGKPDHVTKNEKIIPILIIIPIDQEIKQSETIDKIERDLAAKLHMPIAQVRTEIVQPQMTTIMSLPDQKAPELENLHQQGDFENLKTKYGIEEIKVKDGKLQLSSNSNVLVREEIDKLKVEIASKLDVSPQEIGFEYSGSALVTIALPSEKANLLLRMDQRRQLQTLKQRWGIKELKPAHNLDRYIQIEVMLTIPTETMLLPRIATGLKEAIARKLNLNQRYVRLPTWRSRHITLTLVLPELEASNLRKDTLEDLGMRNLRAIYVGRRKEGLFGILDVIFGSKLFSDTRKGLEHNLTLSIAQKLNIGQNEVKFYWHRDYVTFTFVLPSKSAAILFYQHSAGRLKKFMDFEIQDLQIGRYDWDNYLGLVLVDSN